MTETLLLLALVAALCTAAARWLWQHRRRVQWPPRPCTIAVHRVIARDAWLDHGVVTAVLAEATRAVRVRAEREAQWHEDPSTWPIATELRDDPTTGAALLLVECRIPAETGAQHA